MSKIKAPVDLVSVVTIFSLQLPVVEGTNNLFGASIIMVQIPFMRDSLS